MIRDQNHINLHFMRQVTALHIRRCGPRQTPDLGRIYAVTGIQITLLTCLDLNNHHAVMVLSHNINLHLADHDIALHYGISLGNEQFRSQ